MKKRMKKVATLCLAGVTAMSTVGVTGSAVFAKGDTNYDVDNMDFENVTEQASQMILQATKRLTTARRWLQSIRR